MTRSRPFSTRSNRNRQVTYNGHPLYLFIKDMKPGETNGQGVTAFGAAWLVLSLFRHLLGLGYAISTFVCLALALSRSAGRRCLLGSTTGFWRVDYALRDSIIGDRWDCRCSFTKGATVTRSRPDQSPVRRLSGGWRLA